MDEVSTTLVADRSPLKVAVAQLNSVDSVEINLKSILHCMNLAQGADLVCFPENCLYLRVLEGEIINGMTVDHPALLEISKWAKAYSQTIHLGSVPLIVENKMYNSSIWISSDGFIKPTYRKIHLFDIELEGRAPIRESDAFSRGDSPSIQNFKGWRIAESICYDLRFSELYSKYAQSGVDLILIPSAFLVHTGKAHWESLMRARAIESQAYVVASAQAGVHKSVKSGCRETYGHSLIVGPWGDKLVDLGPEGELVQIFELEKEEIIKVRKQIPMASHRRL